MIHRSLFLAWLSKYTLFGTVSFMIFENIGVPLPIEIGYVLVQREITEGRISYTLVLILFTIAHILGSLISYAVGHLFHERLLRSKDLQAISERLMKWYVKYGSVTVFVARFIGQFRPFSSYVAGVAEMPFIPFLAYTALSSLLFNIVALSLTTVGVKLWQHYPITHLLSYGVYVIGVIWVLLWLTRDKRKKA